MTLQELQGMLDMERLAWKSGLVCPGSSGSKSKAPIVMRPANSSCLQDSRIWETIGTASAGSQPLLSVTHTNKR